MKVEVTGLDINMLSKSPLSPADIMNGTTKELKGKIYCNISARNNLVEMLGSQQVDIKTIPANFKKRIHDLFKDLEEELNK